MKYLKQVTTVVVVLCAICDPVWATGSLYDPPSRPVMWKYGYPTEKNYDYMLLNCGGEKQPEEGPTECGVCGDYVNSTREHELGGKYGTGVIGRYYPPGIKEFHVKVELNSFEGGFFEFRLCPANDKPVTQACLDDYLLPIQQGYVNGTPFRFFPKNAGDFRLTIAVPPKMTCERCVLQWRYHTGNSWGTDPLTGLSGTGKGLQKDFYNCADIRIGGTIPESVLANPFFAPADNRLQNGRIKTAEFMTDSVSVDPVKPTIVDHVSPSVLGALQEFENRENVTVNGTSTEIGIDENNGWMFGIQRKQKLVADTSSSLYVPISVDSGAKQSMDIINEQTTGNQSDVKYVITKFGLQTNTSDQSRLIGTASDLNVGGDNPYKANIMDVAGLSKSTEDWGFVSNTKSPTGTNPSEANTLALNVNHEKFTRLMIDIGNKNTLNDVSPVGANNLENSMDLTNSFNLPSPNIPRTKATGFSKLTVGASSQSFNISAHTLDSESSNGSVQSLNETAADTFFRVGLTNDSAQLLDEQIGNITFNGGGFTRGSANQLLSIPVGDMTPGDGLQGITNTASSSELLTQFTSDPLRSINTDPSQPTAIPTITKEQPGLTLPTILEHGAIKTIISDRNVISKTNQINTARVVDTDVNSMTPVTSNSDQGLNMIGDSISVTTSGQNLGQPFTNQGVKYIPEIPVDSLQLTVNGMASQRNSIRNLASTDPAIFNNVTTSIMNDLGGQMVAEPILETKPTESSFVLDFGVPVRYNDRGFTDNGSTTDISKNNLGDSSIIYNKTTTLIQDIREKGQADGLPIALPDLPQSGFNQSQNPTSISKVPIVTDPVIPNQIFPDSMSDYSTLSDPLINSKSTVNLATTGEITTDSRPLSFDPFNLKQNNNVTLPVNDTLAYGIIQPDELRPTGPSITNAAGDINLAPIIRNEIRADSISAFENIPLTENVQTTDVSNIETTFTDSTMGTFPNLPFSLDSLGVTDTSQIIPITLNDNATVRSDEATNFNSISVISSPNAEISIGSKVSIPILDKSSMLSTGVILDAAEPNSQSKLASVTKTKDITDGAVINIVPKLEAVKETTIVDDIINRVDGLLDSQGSGTLILKKPTVASNINPLEIKDLKETQKVSVDIKLPIAREQPFNLNEAVDGIIMSGVQNGAAGDYKVTDGKDSTTTDIMTFMKDVRATKELMNRKFFSKAGTDGKMRSISQESSTDIQKQLDNFNLTLLPREKVLESNVQVGVDGVLRPNFGQRQDENTRFRNLNRSPDTTSIRTSELERRVSTSTRRSSVNRSDRRERVQIDPRTGMQIRVRNLPGNGQISDRNPGMVLSGRRLRMERGNQAMVGRRGEVSSSRPTSSATRSNGVGRTSARFRPSSQATMASRDRMISNQVSRRTSTFRQPQTSAGRSPTLPRLAEPTFGTMSGFRTGEFGPPGLPPIVSGDRSFRPGVFETGAIGGASLMRDRFPEFPLEAGRGDFISGRGFPLVEGGAFPFGGFPVGGTSPVLAPVLGSGTFDPFMGGTLTPTGFTGF